MRRAGMFARVPVFGLRPGRETLSRSWMLPKPVSLTASPRSAAVCGAPASVVYLVGAPEARRAVEALAARLEVPLEVHVLKRMGPLSMEPSPVRKLRNLQRGDAVIVFSRREVLM